MIVLLDKLAVLKASVVAFGGDVFLKAGQIKNRPGLTQKEITDRTGKRSMHWVKTGQDEHGPGGGFSHENIHHGDHVHYTGGHGEVVSKGQDGVTVKPHGGDTEHRLKYDHVESVEHRGEQDPGFAGAPEDKGASEKAPAWKRQKNDEAPKPDDVDPLFKSEDLSVLPDKDEVKQAGVTDAASLDEKAQEALAKYREWLDEGKGLADQLGYETREDYPQLVKEIESGQHKGGVLLLAGLKGGARLQEKVRNDCKGDWSQITDMVRGTLAVDTFEELPGLIEKLKQSMGAKNIKFSKIKDRFNKALDTGYRDVLCTVDIDGHHCELQLHVKAMLPAKEVAHKLYERQRSLEPIAAQKQDNHKFKKRVDLLIKQQQDIYNPAWESAKKGLIKKGFSSMLNMEKGVKAMSENDYGRTMYFEHNGNPARRANGWYGQPEQWDRQEKQWTPSTAKNFDYNATEIEKDEFMRMCKRAGAPID